MMGPPHVVSRNQSFVSDELPGCDINCNGEIDFVEFVLWLPAPEGDLPVSKMFANARQCPISLRERSMSEKGLREGFVC